MLILALLGAMAAFASLSGAQQIGPMNVIVGTGPDASASAMGWSDGVCYQRIPHVRPGDTLTFNFGPHDVYKMSTMSHLNLCDFTDAIPIAGVGESPYSYTVTQQDAIDSATEGGIYFSCSVGAHCSSGMQRLTVQVEQPLAVELIEERAQLPTSDYLLGVGESECSMYQSGVEVEGVDFLEQNALQSECTDPVLGDDGRYHVSCLSGPATLTPGGVMNSARIMHYPYPKDHRVVVGERTWEFVEGDPKPRTLEGVKPVPINQLYVHHLSGRVILGQGTEGIRRSEPDAPFPVPYGSLTGDEGDLMIFHIIDLREVDEWLECVECRCRDPTGTYLNVGGGDGQTGGVSCCTNCTALEGPTVDYRMRYNVSYSDIPKENTITNVQMLTTDISPVVGKNIEYDVPSFEFIKPQNRKSNDPTNPDYYVQQLERVGAFRDIFKMEFFGEDYAGPETVRLLRCVGHLHIAALGMWIEDAKTGEVICDGHGTHGTGPDDKGFLTAVNVESYETPLEFSADRQVRLIAEYNATILHTGVMGMYFLFISSDVEVSRKEASLTLNVCRDDICDVNLLPSPPSTEVIAEALACRDALPTSPACRFGGLCSCKDFVEHPDSTGCGGVFSSEMGDIPVSDMCALYCDDCPTGCEDELPNGPSCTFGGLCSCEDFVNAPESTGCGGIYSSEWGDVVVNEQCAKYCDACPKKSNVDVIQKEILEGLERELSQKCQYATDDCQKMLTNLYTCGSGWAEKTDKVDANVDSVVKKHGERLALKHSKLGSPSLYRAAEEVGMIMPCNGDSIPGTLGDAPTFTTEEDSNDSAPNSAAIAGGVLGGIAIVGLIILVAGKTRGRKSDEQFDEGEKDDKDRSSSFAATRRETAYGETSHLHEEGFGDDLGETDHGV
mmetsp:Transcript_32797/g.96678  ORF Transcript_32797/g.96678 Transcript_32797/m.96678 type:complete len:894 (-) Transcript_32797:282-2963(-)